MAGAFGIVNPSSITSYTIQFLYMVESDYLNFCTISRLVTLSTFETMGKKTRTKSDTWCTQISDRVTKADDMVKTSMEKIPQSIEE